MNQCEFDEWMRNKRIHPSPDRKEKWQGFLCTQNPGIPSLCDLRVITTSTMLYRATRSLWCCCWTTRYIEFTTVEKQGGFGENIGWSRQETGNQLTIWNDCDCFGLFHRCCEHLRNHTLEKDQKKVQLPCLDGFLQWPGWFDCDISQEIEST